MTDNKTASGFPEFKDDLTLRDVAVACYMFHSLESYNDSLEAVNKAVSRQLDLSSESHRERLLQWLNDWGCRHLAVKQHKTASKSLLDWYESDDFNSLPELGPLWKLEDEELAITGKAYGGLMNRVGALGTRNGKDRVVTIGPTAASKVLFALRPESLPPWDKAMRKHFVCDGSPESYVNFLSHLRGMANTISALCDRNGFSIEDLPHKLERDGSTVVSLINEYLWVTISADCELPSQEAVARWAKW